MKNGHVEFRSVTKNFGEKQVLARCGFDIHPGKFTALIGPSGCGKTTIIDLIAGYDTPSSGTVLVNGSEIRGPSHDRLVVFQETALFPWKTTLDNVMFGPLNRNEPFEKTEREARALLSKLGLASFETKYPIQLSGGMQRRAEFARALINSPSVLLLDEPFRGLDAMTRELMQEFLIRLFEEHRITTVLVTSEIEEAIFLADQVIVLSNEPAVVKEVIEIDIPRPRNLKVLSSRSFGVIQGKILGLLLDEAKKSFSDDVMQTAQAVESYGRATRGDISAEADS